MFVTDATDEDRPSDRLEFRLSVADACGRVSLRSDPGAPVTSFTREQLVAGQVVAGSVSSGE